MRNAAQACAEAVRRAARIEDQPGSYYQDIVTESQVDTFDPDGGPENLRDKRDAQVLFEHREESDALFGLAVRVDDRFL